MREVAKGGEEEMGNHCVCTGSTVQGLEFLLMWFEVDSRGLGPSQSVCVDACTHDIGNTDKYSDNKTEDSNPVRGPRDLTSTPCCFLSATVLNTSPPQPQVWQGCNRCQAVAGNLAHVASSDVHKLSWTDVDSVNLAATC